MSFTNEMTSSSLHSAYGSESIAHIRYLLWGDLAEKEGFLNVGRLFRAISFAEQVHATNHFHAIGGDTVGATVTVGGIFGPNKTTEKQYAALFQKALDAANAGKDIELVAIYICPVCGHTVLNKTPDSFPACGAKRKCSAGFRSINVRGILLPS